MWVKGYKAALSKGIPFEDGYSKAEEHFNKRFTETKKGYSVNDIVNRMKETYTLIPKQQTQTVSIGGYDFKVKEVDGLDKIGLI